MTLGKRSRKRQGRNRKPRIQGRKLQAESLEAKMMLTASLDVERSGSDLVVKGISDDGKDIFTLTSNNTGDGNVYVEIEVDERKANGFDGVIDFTIFQTFNTPTLEAQAATIGGKFLGFDMDAKDGDDMMDGSGMKNLENAKYRGGGGNDTIIGGAKTRDEYHGGDGDDLIKGVDYLDTIIDGGSALPKGHLNNPATFGNVLEFAGPNAVTYTNTTFSIITGTDIESKIGDKRFAGDKIDSSGFVPFRVDKDGKNINEGVKVNGLNGDDTIIGSSGKDNIDGGKGNDNIDGLGSDDNLSGDEGEDSIQGGDGKDTIDGGDDKDTLHGGDGDDNVKGGDADDKLFGDGGKDTLQGGLGNDTLNGGAGDDTLKGDDGSDTGDYSGSPGGIEVELFNNKAKKDGHGNADTLESIENISGSDFDDKILGDGANNVLKGNGGDDKIEGRDGNDTLEGGDGADDLKGGNGNDTIKGDAGKDSIEGNNGDDNISGGADDDTINGDARDESQTGNDIIDGGSGNDEIRGWNGDDAISGGDGKDVIFGGFGNDMLSGGTGSDTIDGGRGKDSLEGGFNELATDVIYFEYGNGKGGSPINDIADVAIAGGFATRDEFVAITDFDDIGEEPDPDNDKNKDWVNTGDAIPDNVPFNKEKNSFTLEQRLDIRDELLNGGPNLVFSDYDGGDGGGGDVLSFGERILP